KTAADSLSWRGQAAFTNSAMGGLMPLSSPMPGVACVACRLIRFGDPVQTPLEALPVSSERSTVKVKALVHATRAGDPASAEAVRRHIAGETNPFVLATMASVLGRAGTPADASLLAPLLDHADARVVANALQAYYLL